MHVFRSHSRQIKIVCVGVCKTVVSRTYTHTHGFYGFSVLFANQEVEVEVEKWQIRSFRFIVSCVGWDEGGIWQWRCHFAFIFIIFHSLPIELLAQFRFQFWQPPMPRHLWCSQQARIPYIGWSSYRYLSITIPVPCTTSCRYIKYAIVCK